MPIEIDAQGSRTKTASTIKSRYLILYNALNASLWLVVLIRTVITIIQDGPGSTYDTVGGFTKWTQTIATLEIIHAVLGGIYHIVRDLYD